MFVKYPANPVHIVNTRKYIYEREVVTYEDMDEEGNTWSYEEVVDHYEKKIVLSDGSIWFSRSKSDFNNFTIGQYVYMGVNATPYELDFFLIGGIEREASWLYVIRR